MKWTWPRKACRLLDILFFLWFNKGITWSCIISVTFLISQQHLANSCAHYVQCCRQNGEVGAEAFQLKAVQKTELKGDSALESNQFQNMSHENKRHAIHYRECWKCLIVTAQLSTPPVISILVSFVTRPQEVRISFICKYNCSVTRRCTICLSGTLMDFSFSWQTVCTAVWLQRWGFTCQMALGVDLQFFSGFATLQEHPVVATLKGKATAPIH